jgi:hypothetical protein
LAHPQNHLHISSHIRGLRGYTPNKYTYNHRRHKPRPVISEVKRPAQAAAFGHHKPAIGRVVVEHAEFVVLGIFVRLHGDRYYGVKLGNFIEWTRVRIPPGL